MLILFLVPKNLWLCVHIVFCLSWIGNVAVNFFGFTGYYFASSSMLFSCNYPILIFYLQWKTKFFPSLLMTCWWYDWLFKIVVMRQTRVALRFIDVKACFLCKYSSISLSSLSLQASSRFSSLYVFLMLSQVENIEDCSNLPFTRLNTFDLTARK